MMHSGVIGDLPGTATLAMNWGLVEMCGEFGKQRSPFWNTWDRQDRVNIMIGNLVYCGWTVTSCLPSLSTALEF